MHFLALALATAAAAGTADPTPAAPRPKEPIDYARDVQPIFAGKCTVCHSGTQLEGQYDMGTHAGVLKGGKRGPAVVPGKPAESQLFLAVTHARKPVMPPKSENNDLTPGEVAVLKAWIEQGAGGGPAGPETKPRTRVAVGPPPAAVKPVRAVAVSPDGAVVAAGRGNQVHLFDARTGAYLRSLTDPDLKTPDGKPAVAAHLSVVESMAYSPDGQTLATGSFQEVTLWDPAAGVPKARLTGFAHNVTCLAYSPDGRLLAAGGGAPTEDGEVRLFAPDGTPVLDLKAAHSDTVFGVSFSPDGKLLATAGADKFVRVFEVPSGRLVKGFEGHTHHVMDVGWTPDGKHLVSAGADNVVKVWDYEKGEKVRDIPGYQKQVTRLAFVGRRPEFLAASGDQQVRLTNAETGGHLRVFGGATDYVYAVAAGPDGKVVAAGGEDGVVRLYDGRTGKLIKAMLPPEAEPKAGGK